MALSNQKCTAVHPDAYDCAGFITIVEVQMSVMEPSRTAQEYHNILALFERAFDEVSK
jgi:hypothetical protein